MKQMNMKLKLYRLNQMFLLHLYTCEPKSFNELIYSSARPKQTEE